MKKEYKILIIIFVLAVIIVGCKKNKEQDRRLTQEIAGNQSVLEAGQRMLGELPQAQIDFGDFNVYVVVPETYLGNTIRIDWSPPIRYYGGEPWDITLSALNRDRRIVTILNETRGTTQRVGSYSWDFSDTRRFPSGAYQIKLHVNNGSRERDSLSRTFSINQSLLTNPN